MATSTAILARAGLGVLADNDDASGAKAMPGDRHDLPAQADHHHDAVVTGEFEHFLADLKAEVEQPLLTAMVHELRLVLQKFRQQQPG